MQPITQIHFWSVIVQLLNLALIGLGVYLVVLLCKALQKYLRSTATSKKKEVIRQSLGQAIKTHRMERGMTQEFVAESLGVSRQAVSKWESGASDPSTANLFALAELFGVKAEKLLENVYKS